MIQRYHYDGSTQRPADDGPWVKAEEVNALLERLAKAAGWIGVSKDPVRYLERYIARSEFLAKRSDILSEG